MPSAKRSALSLEEIVSSDLLDSPFPEQTVRSAKRSVRSKTGVLSSADWAVPLDLVNSPFPEGAVQSSKRSVRSKTTDGVGAGEARYAALAERSAQTADCLMRRVRRHRATRR